MIVPATREEVPVDRFVWLLWDRCCAVYFIFLCCPSLRALFMCQERRRTGFDEFLRLVVSDDDRKLLFFYVNCDMYEGRRVLLFILLICSDPPGIFVEVLLIFLTEF